MTYIARTTRRNFKKWTSTLQTPISGFVFS